MHESWSTGKLSQEVRTQKRNQSLDRGHLSSQGPTQPSIPQADPAPFRPADPAATELVTEVSFLSSRTQTHFPGAPASWLSSGVSERRVVEGSSSAPGSYPPGPLQSTLTRPYSLDTLYPPRGCSLLGTSPICCTLSGLSLIHISEPTRLS